jgi:pyrimidine operon attenuation protein/uracil phosphoribosyltransferase
MKRRKYFKNHSDIIIYYIKENEKYEDIKIVENVYYEHFLMRCLNNRIENLLCDEVYGQIMIACYYYRNDFDEDWNKQRRRFFVVFNVDNNEEKILYIDDVQDGKV